MMFTRLASLCSIKERQIKQELRSIKEREIRERAALDQEHEHIFFISILLGSVPKGTT
jgi:hypothetical protein